MKPGIIIRRLSAHDVDDYRQIRLAALRDTPEAFGSMHAIEAAKPIQAHAARLSTSIVFGAYEANEIIGMIGLKQEDGPKEAHKGFLWGFFVTAGNRREGIGDALLGAAIDAAQLWVEQLMLAVVADSAAIRLYERHGFVTYGVEFRALKTASSYQDEVLMSRQMTGGQTPVSVGISSDR